VKQPTGCTGDFLKVERTGVHCRGQVCCGEKKQGDYRSGWAITF